MIKINNLNKYYNKGKTNEIHVINNTTIEFPEKGFVFLLGPSGCGKTTLLNCIGGLDSFQSGTIKYDNQVLSSSKLDEYRIKNIGFIFQNYCLFTDKSVFDNLKFVIDIFDISEEEKLEKINFALKAVNLEKYKNRLTSQLSGGQMQRVAIARALVKSPKLIIADEPTGNLDERNTKQIMDIIKNLSLECLVIMVTHEKRLANFYADRIIELKDGKVINDYPNENKSTLVEKDDVNIYLGDLSNEHFKNDNVDIRYFYNLEKPNLKLDIVYKNNTFYINPKNDDNYKFKILTKDSEELLIEGKKPVLEIEDVLNEDIKFPVLDKEKLNKNTIPTKETFRNIFNNIKNYKKGDFVKLFIYFLSTFIIVCAIAILGKMIHIDDFDVLDFSKDILVVEESFKSEDVLNNLDYDILIPNMQLGSNDINLKFNIFSDDNTEMQLRKVSLLPYSTLDTDKIIIGSKINNNTEIIIDKFIIERLIKNNSIFLQAGFENYEQLLGIKIEFLDKFNYTIVGIADTKSPNIYLLNESLQRLYMNCLLNNYGQFEYNYKNTTTTKNKYDIFIKQYSNEAVYNIKNHYQIDDFNIDYLNDDEIIVSRNLYSLWNVYFAKDYSFFDEVFASLKIVGFYADDDNTFIANDKTLNNIYNKLIEKQSSYVCFREDEYKLSKDAETFDLYDLAIEQYKEENKYSVIVFSVFAIILFTVALVFLSLTIKANMLSRIYEIGVYRAIGIKKTAICKMFVIEILVIMLISSFVGYILGSIFASNNAVSGDYIISYYPWYSWIISFIIIIASEIIAGIIPVVTLLINTPSEILSKYDI